MKIRKLSRLGGRGSHAVSLPREDLRELGVVDESGELVADEQYVKITRDGDQWRLELV